MKKYILIKGLIFFLALFQPFFSHAEEKKSPTAEGLSHFLGWTIEQAFTQLEAPQDIFPFRAPTNEEDNVVFSYPQHLQLFWFRNRVWQVRIDKNWEGELGGLRMGQKKDLVVQHWGPPINDSEENPTWVLPHQGYPVRARLYFDNNRLVDLYVYRSDW